VLGLSEEILLLLMIQKQLLLDLLLSSWAVFISLVGHGEFYSSREILFLKMTGSSYSFLEENDNFYLLLLVLNDVMFVLNKSLNYDLKYLVVGTGGGVSDTWIVEDVVGGELSSHQGVAASSSCKRIRSSSNSNHSS